MGVQILNKDVSVISSIANVAIANIGNVSGIAGWVGGGGGGGGSTSQGPLDPKTAEDVGYGDNSWNDASNVFTSDNTYATCTPGVPGSITNYFQAYNFGFSIPIGATIDGIEVTIEANSTYADDTLYTFLLWDGEVFPNTGTGYGFIQDAKVLATDDQVFNIGGPTDKWNSWNGENMRPEVVNSTEFGVVFGNEAHEGTISVDHITMKVYYTE